MGKGYWVWLIPLASGNTSIGIVTQNDLHDFPAYSRSYETSFEWLRNERTPFGRISRENKQPLDFRKHQELQLSGSEQLFSEKGWSCVGAGASHPFYSPQPDTTPLPNTFTSNLIGADLQGELTVEKVIQLNDLL